MGRFFVVEFFEIQQVALDSLRSKKMIIKKLVLVQKGWKGTLSVLISTGGGRGDLDVNQTRWKRIISL